MQQPKPPQGEKMHSPATIYVDIETICSPHKPSPDDIPPPGNYKDVAKIRAYQEDKVDEMHRKQALNSMKGEILCIGWAANDEEPQVLIRDGEKIKDEKDLLGAFDMATAVYGPIVWVGHNIKTFDLQWLWRKSIKYECRALAQKIPRQRYSPDVRDTMEIWAGPDYRDMTSLADIAAFLGLDCKHDGMTGVDVYDAYLAGELDRIAEYCTQDVRLTRQIYKIIGG